MAKLSYAVNIAVPLDQCYTYIRNYTKDQRYVQASASLLKVNSPVRITNEKRDSFITFKVNGVNPVTKRTMSGWELKYSFIQTTKGFTQVDLAIKYGLFLGLIGFGTMKYQAKNELVNIISTLIAFEKGYKTSFSCNQPSSSFTV
ncbi:MAG: hypothetical protein ACYDEJ_08540 [Desulfitobacteriaceae bacterium]